MGAVVTRHKINPWTTFPTSKRPTISPSALMAKAWVKVTAAKSTLIDLKFRWGLDPARAFPNGTVRPTTNSVAAIVSAAILSFLIFFPLFSRGTFEHLTVSCTWPLPGISVFASHLPRGVEREVKDSVGVYTYWTHTAPSSSLHSNALHCGQQQTLDGSLRCSKRKHAFTRVYRQHGIAGFLQHSMAGCLQPAISWDANEVPSAKAKKATKLRTPAVIFFIPISYYLFFLFHTNSP